MRRGVIGGDGADDDRDHLGAGADERNQLANRQQLGGEDDVSYKEIVKVGRTHLQDATPITLGQEIGSWVAQIDFAVNAIRTAAEGMLGYALSDAEKAACMAALPAHMRQALPVSSEVDSISSVKI